MKTALIVIAILLILFITIAMYCCCKISGKISQQEEYEKLTELEKQTFDKVYSELYKDIKQKHTRSVTYEGN